MTTKVTVEVPEHADYEVVVSTAGTSPSISLHVTHVEAGVKHEFYLHSGLRVVGIEEVPIAERNS